MPKYVTEKKSKAYLTAAISTTVISLIPVIVFLFISIGNKNIWTAPYPKFILYFLIINTYFAFFLGLIGHINKKLYLVLDIIAIAGTLFLIIFGYIKQDPITIHLGVTAMFYLMIYVISNFGGDNYNFRYVAPLATVLVGLITILWFTGVHVHILAHIIISAILNGIFFLIAIRFIIIEFKDNFDFIEYSTVTYKEETKEEKEEKRQEKRMAKEEKALAKQEKSSGASKEKPLSPKMQMVKEKQEQCIRMYGQNAKWRISPSTIDRWMDSLAKSYNWAVGRYNSSSSYNNSQLRNTTNEETYKEAAAENKSIAKQINKIEHYYKKKKAMFKKWKELRFTIEDCGYTITLNMLNGKMTKAPSKEGGFPSPQANAKGFYYQTDQYLIKVDGQSTVILEKV